MHHPWLQFIQTHHIKLICLLLLLVFAWAFRFQTVQTSTSANLINRWTGEIVLLHGVNALHVKSALSAKEFLYSQ